MTLQLRPIRQKEAFAYIRKYHRHHPAPQGWVCGVAVESDGVVVGVATIGRPVARMLADGYTAEVTRCCTDGTKNAASMLYGACWRASRALGYRRLITYTLIEEPGTSLRAAGFRPGHVVRGRSWDTPARRRQDKHPITDKRFWSKEITHD